MTVKEAIEALTSKDVNNSDMMLEALDMAIKALEEPSYNSVKSELDAISRQEVLDEINRVGVKGFETYNDYSQLYDFVDTLPPVRPQLKTGYWRPIYQGDEIIGYRCSECEFGRTEKIYRANYCHNCGIKMVKPQERNEYANKCH